MTNFLKRKWFKKHKKTVFYESQEPIHVPLSVINDSNQNTSRVLRTKNFAQTKKLKHPSGTTAIRLNQYENLANKVRERKHNSEINDKLIGYKNPTKKIYERKKKEKGEWRY